MINTFAINMRLFWQGAILSYVALFHWLQPTTYMASKIFLPLAQILFFTLLGVSANNGRSSSYFAIGNALQVVAISGIYGVTMSIGGDRNAGTLAYLFATPANRMFMFLGRAFIHIIDGMLGVAIGLLWGVILLGIDFSRTNLLALILTILVTTISTSGLGLLLGCISLVSLSVMFINNTVYFLLLLFSGANVPIETLPGWMQFISSILPLSRGIAAARALVDGATFNSVLPLIAGELLVGIVYITIGYVCFRIFEYQGKRRGTIEAF